jgi:predicted 2-oxoglutarate/Fe(II)-dependent dioxygenase YbiX
MLPTVSRNLLMPGDPAPWFRVPSNVNPDFDFSTAAGRYIVLSFLGPSGTAVAQALYAVFLAERAAFANSELYYFAVVLGDRQAHAGKSLAEQRPTMDTFWDDGRVSRLYGALPAADDAPATDFTPVTYLLGLDLRVLAIARDPDPVQQARTILGILPRLPALGTVRVGGVQAPVLVLPDVFEPALCRRLIEGYQGHGGTESGFMRERDGKTVMVVDHSHKRRSDWAIEDAALRDTLRQRVLRRIVPQIQRAFQFKVTRMERYIVGCYDAAVGGYFQPHRDNTTKGTAHRRFAVTVNLNTEAYEGGALMFPEFGRAVYRPPSGGAVVFSCGLLHQALPVTGGKRYAFLPFLYDDAAAKVRAENNTFLGENVPAYRAEEDRDASAT